MSVTRIAYTLRTRKDPRKSLKRSQVSVTVTKVKLKTDEGNRLIAPLGYYSFLRCHSCFDFIPVDGATQFYRQNLQTCDKCGSRKISYLGTSSGKLFGFVSKHIYYILLNI